MKFKTILKMLMEAPAPPTSPPAGGEGEDPNETEATRQAHHLGLISLGWGKWGDETGKQVAYTVNGQLVKNDPNKDAESGAAPAGGEGDSVPPQNLSTGVPGDDGYEYPPEPDDEPRRWGGDVSDTPEGETYFQNPETNPDERPSTKLKDMLPQSTGAGAAPQKKPLPSNPGHWPSRMNSKHFVKGPNNGSPVLIDPDDAYTDDIPEKEPEEARPVGNSHITRMLALNGGDMQRLQTTLAKKFHAEQDPKKKQQLNKLMQDARAHEDSETNAMRDRLAALQAKKDAEKEARRAKYPQAQKQGDNQVDPEIARKQAELLAKLDQQDDNYEYPPEPDDNQRGWGGDVADTPEGEPYFANPDTDTDEFFDEPEQSDYTGRNPNDPDNSPTWPVRDAEERAWRRGKGEYDADKY